MAAPKSMTFDEIVLQLNAGNYAPVYLIHGEEGFYTDRLLERFDRIVPEADRDFDCYTFYAPQADMDTVIDTCHRYPMMGERQVVIVKEAQGVTATELDRLHLYTERPSASTVLVVASRGAKCEAKKLIKGVGACGGVVFESQSMKERDVAVTISKVIKQKGLNVEAKGLGMLTQHVGTDLARLYNEVEKLSVALPAGAMITPEVVEKLIGVSKDYNIFEFISALSTKNAKAAFTIVNYFRHNPKANPFPPIIAMIWSYFANLLVLHYAKDKTDAGLCAAIGRKGSWLPPDYKNGMCNYNAWKLIDILRAIRVADAQSKGVGSRMDPYDILYNLVFYILTAGDQA